MWLLFNGPSAGWFRGGGSSHLHITQRLYAQQDITVRVLDYKSGKPIANLKVMVEGFNGEWSQGRVATRTLLLRTVEKTDKRGLIAVHLPDPLPEHI